MNWSQARNTFHRGDRRLSDWIESGVLSFDPRSKPELDEPDLAELRFLEQLSEKLGDSPTFVHLARRLQRPVRFAYGDVAFSFADDSWVTPKEKAPTFELSRPQVAAFNFANARRILDQSSKNTRLLEREQRIAELLGNGLVSGGVYAQLRGLEDLVHTGVLDTDLRRIATTLEEDLDGYDTLVDRMPDLRDAAPDQEHLRHILFYVQGTKIAGRARPLLTRALFAGAPRSFVPLDNESALRAVLGLQASARGFHSDDLAIAAGSYAEVLRRAHDIARSDPSGVGRLLAADPCTALDHDGRAVKSWPRVLDRLAWVKSNEGWTDFVH